MASEKNRLGQVTLMGYTVPNDDPSASARVGGRRAGFEPATLRSDHVHPSAHVRGQVNGCPLFAYCSTS
jgi:hypothetical protein